MIRHTDLFDYSHLFHHANITHHSPFTAQLLQRRRWHQNNQLVFVCSVQGGWSMIDYRLITLLLMRTHRILIRRRMSEINADLYPFINAHSLITLDAQNSTNRFSLKSSCSTFLITCSKLGFLSVCGLIDTGCQDAFFDDLSSYSAGLCFWVFLGFWSRAGLLLVNSVKNHPRHQSPIGRAVVWFR